MYKWRYNWVFWKSYSSGGSVSTCTIRKASRKGSKISERWVVRENQGNILDRGDSISCKGPHGYGIEQMNTWYSTLVPKLDCTFEWPGSFKKFWCYVLLQRLWFIDTEFGLGVRTFKISSVTQVILMCSKVCKLL